jgi:hypothetical protein
MDAFEKVRCNHTGERDEKKETLELESLARKI